MERRKCIVVMVGLPAAGKSTLSRDLKQKLDKTEVIEFDQIEREINSSDTFDPQSWCEARKIAMKRAIEIFQCNSYVVLDDNFYYRSMRKPYYQLARDHSYSYLEVYLPISLEDALQRNSQRPSSTQIPAHVLLSMSNKLEATLYPSHAYEHHSSTTSSVDLLISALQTAQIPPPLQEEQHPQVDAQTFLHNVDQHLRKTFSTLMQQEDPQLKKHSKALNEIRQSVYQALKLIVSGNKEEKVKISREGWEELWRCCDGKTESNIQGIEQVFRFEVNMKVSQGF